MAGHSHWAGIKHKKEAADKKRGQLFSKLLNAVAIAARPEPNPEFNPRLRTAVEKARQNQVPQESIERAIKRASENKNLEEVLIEAYGPAGAAIMIETITDNKNRTIQEIKTILNETGAKFAEPGSVLWVFQKTGDGRQAKFPQEIPDDDKAKLEKIIEGLNNHDDVQKVYTNIANNH